MLGQAGTARVFEDEVAAYVPASGMQRAQATGEAGVRQEGIGAGHVEGVMVALHLDVEAIEEDDPAGDRHLPRADDQSVAREVSDADVADATGAEPLQVQARADGSPLVGTAIEGEALDPQHMAKVGDSDHRRHVRAGEERAAAHGRRVWLPHERETRPQRDRRGDPVDARRQIDGSLLHRLYGILDGSRVVGLAIADRPEGAHVASSRIDCERGLGGKADHQDRQPWNPASTKSILHEPRLPEPHYSCPPQPVTAAEWSAEFR